MRTLETDVLIVGSGGAALRAAIAARETPNCSGAQEDDGVLIEEGAEPVKLEEAPLQFALARLLPGSWIAHMLMAVAVRRPEAP